MTPAEKKASELALAYICSEKINVDDSFTDHKDSFLAGFRTALELAEVKALVEASHKYLNQAPTDGWHFSDCDANEDNYEDQMPCSCGAGEAEVKLYEALTAWRSFRGEK